MTDRQTVTKYTIEDLWKLPCYKQSHFSFMTLLCIAFQLNSVPHPKNMVAICSKWSWVLWILNETYFNQNWFKRSYMLSKTCIWNISAHSDHDHLCWASRKTSFQFTCAVINIRYEKKYPSLVFLLADISIYCFDSRKQSFDFLHNIIIRKNS